MASSTSSAAGSGSSEVKKFWSNGQLKYHKKEDGTIEEFEQKGRILYRELPDGTVEEHTPIEVEQWARASERGFAQVLGKTKYRSVMTYKKLPDGVVERYSLYSGKLEKRLYLDGSYEEYNVDGQTLREKKYPDGTMEYYCSHCPLNKYNGRLQVKELPDGSWFAYKPDGTVFASGGKDDKNPDDCWIDWKR